LRDATSPAELEDASPHFFAAKDFFAPQGRMSMPAKSKAQQKAAGAALAAKRGERSKSSLKGASKSMAKSMSEKELKKMASTSRRGKPEHASKKRS
jgi:hypothetical protein